MSETTEDQDQSVPVFIVETGGLAGNRVEAVSLRYEKAREVAGKLLESHIGILSGSFPDESLPERMVWRFMGRYVSLTKWSCAPAESKPQRGN